MSFSIFIAKTAERDILNALDYIEYSLKYPKAADDLLNEIDLKINSLSSFPSKNTLIDDPILSAWGVRYIRVKNYIVFYIINEEEQQISIIRFLYAKSNWNAILKNRL